MKRNVIKILTFLFLFIITKSLFVHSDYICAEVTSQKYTGYKDNKFYFNGELANWWYDDGSAWYFFKDGWFLFIVLKLKKLFINIENFLLKINL